MFRKKGRSVDQFGSFLKSAKSSKDQGSGDFDKVFAVFGEHRGADKLPVAAVLKEAQLSIGDAYRTIERLRESGLVDLEQNQQGECMKLTDAGLDVLNARLGRSVID